MKRSLKNNRTLIIFYFLIAYVILQFLWWGFHIIDLSEQIESNDGDLRNTISMIVGEAAVFFIIIFTGAFYVIRSYFKEMALAKKEKNFALSVTHELKTPIASSKLFAQTLLERKDLNIDQQKESLSKIIDEQNRLNDLVEKILMASSINDEALILSKSPVPLKNLLDNIIAQHAKSHQFINEIGEDVIINGDEFYLISLFHNLIENAKKYSEKLTSITFTSKKINENVIISIADEGIGIKDEFKQKIYERFFRIGDEETRSTKGTGLGLFLVKEIVKLHGAQISCKDNLPKGIIFDIRFNLIS